MNNFLIGTIGHIDHGKTFFIEKLTNKNLDTLPEEKERNMTIDIGFTDLYLDEKTKVGIVDMPGHEKFIKNMTAGIVGVNFIILIIACDDGIMPQTIEHFNIVRLLGINNGIVVLTKKDKVNDKRFHEVFTNTKEFFKDTFLEDNIYFVDKNDLESYEKIKKIILAKIKDNYIKNKNFRMNIDRVFNVHGIGKILTGTILSGKISKNDIKTLYPQNIKVRIKNIQNHGMDVLNLDSQKRCAINIAEKIDIKRGDVIADFLYLSKEFDVKIYILENIKKLKNNHRIRLNIGTQEVMGKVILYEKNFMLGKTYSYGKIILEKEIPINYGDIGILRDFSPIRTLGNIKILNPKSQNKLRYDKNYMKMLEDFDTEDDLKLLEKIIFYNKLENMENENLEKLMSLGKIKKLYNSYIHIENIKEIKNLIEEILKNFYLKNHLKTGEKKENIYKIIKEKYGYSRKDFNILLNLLDFNVKSDIISLKDYKIKLNKEEKNIKEIIFKMYKEKKFDLTEFNSLDYNDDFLKIHEYMVEFGFIINLPDNYYILSGYIKEIIKVLNEYFEKNDYIILSEFRKLFNLKRNIAIILLNYLTKNMILDNKNNIYTLIK